jgi:uncharacterized protein YaaN involved in tellurite resistance
MNIDERIAALTANLESLRLSTVELRMAAERHSVDIESLHWSASELHAASQLHTQQIAEILKASRQDGENIRALARIAELHSQRLSNLEGPDIPSA